MRPWLAAGIVLLALPCTAQPRLENARPLDQSAGGTLEAAVQALISRSVEPEWVTWTAPVADGRSRMCCGGDDRDAPFGTDAACRLEPGSGPATLTRRQDQAITLEPAETFSVFLRLADRRIERVRSFSDDCRLDAGGTRVTRLTGVGAGESVAFLATLAADADADRRAARGALTALAQHGGPDAVATLVRLAREPADSKVRGDALFWLSQRAGARAAATITDAIEHDPETDVKKRAVFALAQLPPDEGVPKLIAVARTNRNPAVRRQAMFWLGQSKDPRALAFFEEVLR